MTYREHQLYLKKIEEAGKKISKSKKTADKFLMEVGFFNKDGSVNDAYKNLYAATKTSR